MVLPDKVLERQRQEDLRHYRKYLVESGSIQALVKLYKHILKKEMRMDNPALLKEFLGQYREDSPEQQEIERLAEENANLSQKNEALEQRLEEMKLEIDQCHRLRTAKALWKCLTSREFWEGYIGADAPDMDALGTSLTVDQLFLRLCGQKVDHSTGKVIVNLVRPTFLEDTAVSSAILSSEAFSEWMVYQLAEDVYLLIAEDLLPRFSDLPRDAPFESELMQAIRESGLYPEHLSEVHEVIELDRSVATFLEVTAERFASAVEEVPAPAGGDPPEEEEPVPST